MHAGAPEKTAAVVIIGNEILSGRIEDTNSRFLTVELRKLGIKVRRIVVIPDDREVIGEEISRCSAEYDVVFAAGGIGPTHDDVTMAGIARGFGVSLTRHPGIVSFFRSHYGKDLNDAVLKMTEVPEDSVITGLELGKYPLISFRNVYIFPGIPEYLRQKFALVRETLMSPPYHLRKIYLRAGESDIAAGLEAVVENNPDVEIGSYPVVGNGEFSVIITIESKSKESLDRSARELLSALSEEIVVKIE